MLTQTGSHVTQFCIATDQSGGYVLVVIRSLRSTCSLLPIWTTKDVGSALDRTKSGLLCDARGVGWVGGGWIF